MKKISVVAPVYNEEPVLDEFMKRMLAVLEKTGEQFEVLLVNDGSRDKTPEMVDGYTKKYHGKVRGIHFSRNFGHQAAVTAGIEHAQGEMIVVTDADLQDPPEIIPKFIEKYKEGYDVVYAVRRERNDQWWRDTAIKLTYRFISRMAANINLPTDAGDFSLISKRVARAMAALPERNRYVRGLRAWVGFKQIGVEYERDKRFAGETGYPFWKLVKLAYDGIFSFSYMPITFVNIVGAFVSVLSFIGIIIVIYLKFFGERDVPGFTALAVIILFFGGIQLLAFGVLGEYIRRIYDETKSRPQYIIAAKKGFDG